MSNAAHAVVSDVNRQRCSESRKQEAQAVAVVPVGQFYFALVDQADFERVIHHGWSARITEHNVYATTRIAGRQVLLHRFVLNAEPSTLVDHRNRIGLDCRKTNLRLATAGENAFNRKRDVRNTSGYKGVSFHAQAKKWRALIKVGDRWISLGLHHTAEAAALVYDAAAREHFGEFARLNFPKEGEQAA